MAVQCPGSKLIKEPSPEEIICQKCKATVEIWSDERRAKCRNCGHITVRELTQSCLDWCVHAKECMGQAYEERGH